MPLQNRVTPYGEIVADRGRGLLMGNRGCLHGSGLTLGASRWRSKLWICCVLDWKGVQRAPMPPGRWTALFFLDEATALAAGHRPCAYCRRGAYLAYATAWQAHSGLAERPRATEMDTVLHASRVDSRTRRQRTWPSTVDALPDGTMVDYEGAPALVLDGGLRPWAFAGYGPPVRPPAGLVEVLTPPASVGALAAGYRPLLHPTATPAGRHGRRQLPTGA
ncbi:hypothetical protein [Hamadaea tsunoensis]|uniref:hypothetical protein n=1 Tax=Hamadaea tsunoensis TaxID=53368 RepID=UPI0004127B3F|nr:hypothetical protein [Hamadaea tsunoensis]